MNKQNAVKLFHYKQVRAHWDAEQEKRYFVVADVVAVLSASTKPSGYIKKMRKRPRVS